MLKLDFNFRLFILLSLGFVLATIIGTVTHEMGHLIVAELMGLEAKINYASTWIVDSESSMDKFQEFIFILGGPLQTILTGTLGLILLFIKNKKIKSHEKLSFYYWVLIFMSLFWLRQSANLVTWIVGYISTGNYSGNLDEVKLSAYFYLPPWLIILISGIIGIGVLLFVIIKYIPQNHRFTFILSGIFGGVAGYLFWLKSFGKIIFP